MIFAQHLYCSTINVLSTEPFENFQLSVAFLKVKALWPYKTWFSICRVMSPQRPSYVKRKRNATKYSGKGLEVHYSERVGLLPSMGSPDHIRASIRLLQVLKSVFLNYWTGKERKRIRMVCTRLYASVLELQKHISNTVLGNVICF